MSAGAAGLGGVGASPSSFQGMATGSKKIDLNLLRERSVKMLYRDMIKQFQSEGFNEQEIREAFTEAVAQRVPGFSAQMTSQEQEVEPRPLTQVTLRTAPNTLPLAFDDLTPRGHIIAFEDLLATLDPIEVLRLYLDHDTLLEKERSARRKIEVLMGACAMCASAETTLRVLMAVLQLKDKMGTLPLKNKTERSAILLNKAYVNQLKQKLLAQIATERDLNEEINGPWTALSGYNDVEASLKNEDYAATLSALVSLHESLYQFDTGRAMHLHAAINPKTRRLPKNAHVALIVGNSGVGKSTLVHWCGGSVFKGSSDQLSLKKAPIELNEFVIGTETSSETCGLDWYDIRKSPFADKQTRPILLVDSPGGGDTDLEQRLSNSDFNLLQDAEKVCIISLINVHELCDDPKATKFISALERLSALVENVKEHESILFVFSWADKHFDPKRIIERVNKLLTDSRLTSIHPLLLRMQTQFKNNPNNVLLIQPNLGKLKPADFLKMIEAIPAAKPAQLLKSYIEDEVKDKIYAQIPDDIACIDRLLKQLTKDIIAESPQASPSDIKLQTSERYKALCDKLYQKIEEVVFLTQILTNAGYTVKADEWKQVCKGMLCSHYDGVAMAIRALLEQIDRVDITPCMEMTKITNALSCWLDLFDTPMDHQSADMPSTSAAGAKRYEFRRNKFSLDTFKTAIGIADQHLHTHLRELEEDPLNTTLTPTMIGALLDNIQAIKDKVTVTDATTERSEDGNMRTTPENNPLEIKAVTIHHDYEHKVFQVLTTKGKTSLDSNDFVTCAEVIKSMAGVAKTPAQQSARKQLKTDCRFKLHQLANEAIRLASEVKLTEDSVSQLQQTMAYLTACLEAPVVLEQLEHDMKFAVEVSLQKREQALVSALAKHYQSQVNKIGQQFKQHAPISVLNDPVEQLRYLLAILPNHPTFPSHFERTKEQICAYVVEISTEFRTKLPVGLTADEYAEMQHHLDSLTTCPWVEPFNLNQDAKAPLLKAIESRVSQLKAFIQAAPFDIGHSDELKAYSDIKKEIELLRQTMLPYFTSSECGKVAALDITINAKINDTLNKIMQTSPATPLNTKTFSQCIKYVKQCRKLNILTDQANKAEKKLYEQLQLNTANKTRMLRDALVDFDLSTATSDTVDLIGQILQEYRALQIATPEEYTACGKPLVSWTQMLRDALANFDRIMNAYFTDAEFEKLEKLIPQSHLLRKLDTYLDLPDDDEILSFKTIHTHFKTLLSDEYSAAVQTIMRNIQRGEYKEASEQLPTLKPSVQVAIKRAIQAQFNDSVAFLTHTMQTLRNSQDFTPPQLKLIKKALGRIREATPLIEHALLVAELGSLRDDCLEQTQAAIDFWFKLAHDRVLNLIADESIPNHLYEADNAMLALTNLVDDGMIQPANSSAMLIKEKESLESLIQSQLRLGESIPCTQWSESLLVATYNACHRQGKSTTRLSQFWQDLTTLMRSKGEFECEEIGRQLMSDNLTIEAGTQQLSYLVNLVKKLPNEEITGIKGRITQLAVNVITSFQTALLAETSTGVDLNRLSKLVKNESLLKLNLGPDLDLTLLNRHLQKQVIALKQQIITAITQNPLPKAEEYAQALQTLLELHTLFKTKPFVDNAYNEVKSLLQRLSRDHLGAIVRALSQIQAGKHLDEKLSILGASLQWLAEINTLIRQLAANPEHRALVKAMQPDLPEIESSLKPLMLELQAISQAFNMALNARKIDDLMLAIQNSRKWSELLPIITNLLATYGDEEKQNGLGTLEQLIRKYNHEGLQDRLQEHLVEIKTAFTTLQVQTLLMAKQNSNLRAQFFFALKQDLSFISAIAQDKGGAELFGVFFGKEKPVEVLSNCLLKYLETVYDAALATLPDPITAPCDWTKLSFLYAELQTFKDSATEPFSPALLRFKDQVNHLADDLSQRFDASANEIIKHATDRTKNQQEVLKQAVAYAIALQKGINDLPNPIKSALSQRLTDFFNMISAQKNLGAEYKESIRIGLTESEDPTGQQVANNHPCFRGSRMASLNEQTRKHGIDHVLRELTTNSRDLGVQPLPPAIKAHLKQEYKRFETFYEAILEHYQKVMQTLNSPAELKPLLEPLKANFYKVLEENPISFERDGSPIWTDLAKSKIAQALAIFFARWTLSNVDDYMNPPEGTKPSSCLKKPHAAQIVAIFQLLNVGNNQQKLVNHLAEIKTGEGKSVVNAALASILALFGYEVYSACYSEYLSARDCESFKEIFEALGIAGLIHYGTINPLVEDVLNESGDIRDHVEAQINTPASLASSKSKHAVRTNKFRPKILLIDEVDIFFTNFYGEFYQPMLLLQNQLIIDLMEVLWNKKRQGAVPSIQLVRDFNEYKELIKHYDLQQKNKRLMPLFDNAIQKMLTDLSTFDNKKLHDYRIKENHVVYPYQDGTTLKEYRGFKTLWAYFQACHEVQIPQKIRDEQAGVLLACGTYAYAETVKSGRFKAILGVSGTLDMDATQSRIVCDKEAGFNVGETTFVPSVYGPSQLDFRSDNSQWVLVLDKANYFIALANELDRQRRASGVANCLRPVIIFFKDEAALDAFLNSAEFKPYKNEANIMKDGSPDGAIVKATQRGTITLATIEQSRGRDFVLVDKLVIDNNGIHVLDTCLVPKADQTQMQGRSARQGQKGSFSMVLFEDDLIKEYGITATDIERKRKKGTLYQYLDDLRSKKFAEKFKKLDEEMQSAIPLLHKPSMEMLNQLIHRPKEADSIAEKLIRLNAVSKSGKAAKLINQSKPSRTLIAIDATGSMGNLISMLKVVVRRALESFVELVIEYGLDPKHISLAFAAFRSYNSKPDEALETTPFITLASDSKSDQRAFYKEIDRFLERLVATGGYREEAMELALQYANRLAKMGTPATQIAVFGDMPATPSQEIVKSLIEGGSCKGTYAPTYWKDEAIKLTGTPIHAHYVVDAKPCHPIEAKGTPAFYKELSEITGVQGSTGELKLTDATAAAKDLSLLLIAPMIKDLTKDNEALGEEMLEQFKIRSFAR